MSEGKLQICQTGVFYKSEDFEVTVSGTWEKVDISKQPKAFSKGEESKEVPINM